YAAPVLPFVMLAAVMGVARVKERIEGNGTRITRIEQIGADQNALESDTAQSAKEDRNASKDDPRASAKSAPSAFYWSIAAVVLGGALVS
ncbi:MAG: hypothetical protein KDE01_34225, partial [Caldilineaceae bacterium]|nr:hypothetical protein [Caldilineaceae bacterium]